MSHSEEKRNIILQSLSNQVKVTFSKSSGPGGQNVNKLHTKATLRWNPLDCDYLTDEERTHFVRKLEKRLNRQGEVVIHCDQHRDQRGNLREVLSRLQRIVSAALKTEKKRRVSRVPLGSKLARLDQKKKMSKKKRSRAKIEAE